MDAVLQEVRRRVAQGRGEIVLTGVNIGLYRDPDSRAGLDRLLTAVADEPGVTRVRISSIEINHVNRRLVAAMATHLKVCPHLHVPLQSGDDGVLADMGRHYDTARYARAIEHARARLPHLNLTTDIIVGYPTEDEGSFQRTLAFARAMGFTKVHAFPFSERPGTDATQHRDPIERAVKADRSQRLRAQAEELALAHRTRLV
jgi:threonylcarbamoyladenosine tRNA methylthiotransferase MtaB